MTSPGIFSALAHYVRLARTRRREIRTIRLLNALPPEVRDDIGWPELHIDENGHLVHGDAPATAKQDVTGGQPLRPHRKAWIAPSIPPQCPA